MIYRGVDAQLRRNLQRAKNLGSNAMHRYDPEGATLLGWTQECQRLGMKYILQGTVCEAQGYEWWKDPNLISLGQDDEPDLNRWSTDPAKQHPELFYTQAEVDSGKVHKNMLGWTRYSVLQERYNRWKTKAPSIPVSVNFSGQTLTNQWTIPSADFHIPYLAASDRQTLDLYVANNQPDRWAFFSPWTAARKLTLAGGNVVGGYFECSFQKLKDSAGRMPTINEVLTEIWGWIYHGATEIWAFPQVIGNQFEDYWGMPPEIEKAVTDAFRIIAIIEDFITSVKPTIIETPTWMFAPTKGTLTTPLKGSATWLQGSKAVTVDIDFTGKAAPVIGFSGFEEPAPPIVIPTAETVTKAQYDAVVKEKEVLAKQMDNLTAQNEQLNRQIAGLNLTFGNARSAWKLLNDTFL